MKKIYLDYNASTPIAPDVSRAMQPYLAEHYGNPSSSHWAGAPAKAAVEKARSQLAGLLGCKFSEVVFTSGGTESNNYAIKGTFFALQDKGSHIITSQIEHPAVIQPCKFLEKLGAQITYLPVDARGLVDPDDIKKAIKAETILVSIMHANNETGSIQPISEISKITRERGVWLHSDAAQSVGKIACDVLELGVDLLSVAGHKVYAPKGVGAIFIRQGIELVSFMHGAGHESGRRAGTENVLLNVGLGAAAELAEQLREKSASCELRDLFFDDLQGHFGDRVVLNGHPTKRLPNTLYVSFVGKNGSQILQQLEGVAASTGAACHADSVELSAVLEAMQIDKQVGMGAIRFSLGRATTRTDIKAVVEMLKNVVSG
ncbi:MAG: cysteine desulfurase [Deltaproteobacteria bacterium]|nr:cysteine desulfurase [Deltaproteobacteria bacterium]